MTTAEEHEICQPELPYYRKCPPQIEDGSEPHISTSAEAYFCQIYFEACDILHVEMEYCFNDRHISSVLSIKKIFKNVANGHDYEDTIKEF